MSVDLYSALRPLFFAIAPERAHALALSSLDLMHRLHVLPGVTNAAAARVEFMGLSFPNRIGLAAGLDKNGRHIDALGALGFGFIEIGTVTPQPQPGQPLPRVFRLPRQQALINRMGFPNEGADAVVGRLMRRKYRGVLGINIGKNAWTPLESAIDDYVTCYRKLAPHADYVTVNVSSPNTQGLRQLQQVDNLRPILSALMEERHTLSVQQGRTVPLLAKVSPDLSEDELRAIAHLLIELNVSGIIATNTTTTRPPEVASASSEAGGLSGAPMLGLAQRAVAILKAAAGNRLTIIGAGGIGSSSDAIGTLRAGADLIQIYSGLIYRGPGLVRELREAIRS
ncbi:quinone-dependent dihydroorotate dehydrogenase [Povalibacter sp.]|uniref:quinone-dependent dihydroorotate dehydrogenase n=1 Tax=Povalibacter sp. TaxID=1962978 RepID=UPI0032C22E17